MCDETAPPHHWWKVDMRQYVTYQSPSISLTLGKVRFQIPGRGLSTILYRCTEPWKYIHHQSTCNSRSRVVPNRYGFRPLRKMKNASKNILILPGGTWMRTRDINRNPFPRFPNNERTKATMTRNTASVITSTRFTMPQKNVQVRRPWRPIDPRLDYCRSALTTKMAPVIPPWANFKNSDLNDKGETTCQCTDSETQNDVSTILP